MEHPYTKACRLYTAKLSGDNISYSDIYKQVFDVEISNEEARKRLRFVRDAMASGKDCVEDSFEKEVLFKDEFTALKQERRELARLRRLEDIVKETVKELSPSPLYSIPNDISVADILSKEERANHAILQLSDIHYGLIIDNAWNKYDTDICRNRMSDLARKVAKRCVDWNVKNLTVVIQGDLISGNIHNIIRLQNQVNVIDQIKRVSEIIISFLDFLSEFMHIDVYFVDGNHERATPNKDDNLPDENLLELIRWFIDYWFADFGGVDVHDNDFGSRLATFEIGNRKIAAVHGDYDKFQNLYNNVTTMTKTHYDIILTAHNHHTHFQDVQNCFVVSNGCVCGPDEYSVSLRLFAKPSQNLIILEDNGLLNVAPIVLD